MFNLKKADIDWVTFTTFDDVRATELLRYTLDWGINRDASRMQYTGTIAHDKLGSVFVGVGEQRGKDHVMMQASGLAGDRAFSRFAPVVGEGGVRCTRLDVQITVPYDRQTWSQARLFQSLRDLHKNRSISYAESQSGPAGSKLATVYFGSRTSDRVVRIYEKAGMGEDVYLRFEVEFKGARAMQAAADIKAGAGLDEILRHEVERVGHHGLTNLLTPYLVGHGVHKVTAVSESGNTLRWLQEQVAPALDRVLRDDNLDASPVAELLLKIIRDSKYWTKPEK